MANLFLFFLLTSLHFLSILAGPPTASDPSSASNFIKASCRTTRYPTLCVKCLSSYAGKIQPNEKELAQAALSVSLGQAQAVAHYVSGMAKVAGIKPREYRAVKDCIDQMGDSVDQIRKSTKELVKTGRAYGEDFIWHMSNVQTWVSAALTDENTCLDGFSGSDMDGNVKAGIRKKVVYVAQVTSNALALVNRFATRHRAAVP